MTIPTNVVADTFSAPIAQEIWESKYQLKEADGTPIDKTPQDTWRRISDALADAEPSDKSDWSDTFYTALEDFKFLPAGRIAAGAGTGRNVTMSNCFTMGKIGDSLSSIFDHLKEAALTMQAGGGIGYDFSPLRPKGSLVKGVAADASGPLSFMDVWDTMCRTIMSAGGRRGAMMATMRCDHPDIEEFITAKQESSRLRKFNLSVLITDSFMEAVDKDLDWALVHEVAPAGKPAQFEGSGLIQRPNGSGAVYVHKVVRARYLWDLIMKSTYAYAEPGVIFIDRVNADHNINYLETICTTNPCGEKPMGPYASCLLGSINLATLVQNPFTPSAYIDEEGLCRLVSTAIRMMDNVIDVGNFPLEAQKQKALEDRQLGLGITGLADALTMIGITYGTEEAASQAEEWMRIISHAAYRTSIQLAQEKGAFPTFDVDGFLAHGTHASRLPEDIQNGIREHGIRNALLTSIAPTGTISLYAGNISSGIEPIFATSYNRRVLTKDGEETWQVVEDYAVAAYRDWYDNNVRELWQPELDTGKDLPDYFVTAQTLTPEAHVRMQAAVQKHVDSSISKTVNLPEDISFEDFKAVYMKAYDSGCKGCTTYRPNDVTGSVLSVEEAKTEEPVDSLETLNTNNIMERPEALEGATYKLKWPGSDHALYITISDIIEEGVQRPFEIFINSKNMEHFQWTVALTRMISAVFRRGGDVSFVVEELKSVFDPQGGAWVKGKYLPSILAAIGGVIELHMQTIGYAAVKGSLVPPSKNKEPVETEVIQKAVKLCSKCHSSNFIKEGGCEICKDCGHSACG